ncbi:hypothetical protein [Paractinoplanes hotanensis]|uniref:Uncharacterized protein n=1 Tax=Paractinoplanes hotanensis TaxID=2906497 RepID=A0ABT0Y1L4_9ACTN|nr:hypothetical protein [Actinoplanes hotanensis]MCM4079928.1 hypothetical protein [Actinoplanes hotanensis]
MGHTSMWPGGVFLSFGLWPGRDLDEPALAAVADVLEQCGGTYSGAMFFGPTGLAFSRVPDAPGISYAGARSAREVRRGLRDGCAYRVAMNLPGVGQAAVSFEATPGEELPAGRHPVDVTVEAGAFALPRSIWDERERAAAEVREEVVLRYFEACCAALDPAYAVLHSEGSTPTPAALAGGQQLGTDVYVSRRLGLGARLNQVARLSQVREWTTGTFYSGWFLTETPDLDALLAAWTRPSIVIGERLIREHVRPGPGGKPGAHVV